MWIATWCLGFVLFSCPNCLYVCIGRATAQNITSCDPLVTKSKPQNLTVTNVTSRSITITWLAPKDGEDGITNYNLYYSYDNNTYARLLAYIHTYTILDLKPFTEYQIHVVAKCGNHIKSESSDTIMQFTDIDGPGPPIIINATCVPGTNGTSIFLQWTKPQLFYKSVDEYIIYVSYDTDFVKKFNFSLPKDSNNINHFQYVVQNLTGNTMYELKINGVTNSVLGNNAIEGKTSEPRSVYLHKDCDNDSTLKNNHNLIENTKSLLIGLCCVLGLLFIVAVILFWQCHPVCRVYFHAAYYYLEDPPFVSHTVPTLPNSDWWKHKQESHVVTVDSFAKHVANLHVDGDIGFSKEYEIIQEESMNFDFSTESSQLPENKTKNRYLNIVPFIDVYSEWCGPCVAMTTCLRKIKMESGSEYLNFAIAKSDNINVLKRFRQKSEPYWMFFFDGKLVNVIIGADAPRLIRLVMEELEQYVKYKNGEIHKEFIPISKVTDEEQKKLTEIENYRKQKTRKEKKLRDKRMMKVRERALKQFSYNIQMQTCVMFFPHTVQHIMVEKPLEEGAEELDEPPEPVMIEKRVCEVANSCASKYEELIVIEAKEVKLTEDKLSEMFFTEREFLESFPQELIDELLSKNVYSVMLSMPTVKHDTATEEATDDENKPVSIDLMGEIELKLSTIIYGDNGSPLNPSPDSLADIHSVINENGQKIPSVYTPRNPLSKASALTILFRKFCKNNGYVAPLPPAPQYLIIFDINKSNTVLPIIEDLEETVLYYGFFRSADPENPKLLCKDPNMLTKYGMDKIGKEAKLVLSVLMDDKDKSLLRFVDLGPIYVSPDEEVGIDDAITFFPYNFDEMDGEIKLWLDQQEIQSEGVGEEYDFGEGEEGIIEEYSSQDQ